jgi:hypothetical protein
VTRNASNRPARFIGVDMDTKDIPYGYCHCGCGRKTKIATRTLKSDGVVKGEPLMFLQGHAYKAKRPEVRFWENVDKGNDDECWNWKGGISKAGYGEIGVYVEHIYAHRYSWMLHNGDIPSCEGHRHTMVIRHKCDNPLCVNPNHLEIGTQQDNLMDCVVRGRRPRGSKHWSGSRMTDEIFDKIISMHNDGCPYTEISSATGFSTSAISHIVNGIHWKCMERKMEGTW